MLQHTHPIRVRYVETDKMGFAHHGSYLPWFEAARIALLDAIGLPYREIEAAHAFLPVIEAHAEYLLPAFFDDPLDILATIAERPKVRFRIDYEVRRGPRLLARGYTRHAFIGPDGHPIRPPQPFLQAMQPFFPSPSKPSA